MTPLCPPQPEPAELSARLPLPPAPPRPQCQQQPPGPVAPEPRRPAHAAAAGERRGTGVEPRGGRVGLGPPLTAALPHRTSAVTGCGRCRRGWGSCGRCGTSMCGGTSSRRCPRVGERLKGGVPPLWEGPVDPSRVRVPPSELSELPLVRLDFSCNRVVVIPRCFRRLRHLQMLLADNNPLQFPPAQVSGGPGDPPIPQKLRLTALCPPRSA